MAELHYHFQVFSLSFQVINARNYFDYDMTYICVRKDVNTYSYRTRQFSPARLRKNSLYEFLTAHMLGQQDKMQATCSGSSCFHNL